MNSNSLLLAISFLLLPQLATAQGFEAVDDHARNTPSSKATSVEKLADHLTQKFDSEHEKVRAIYVWMAENIRYNLATLERAGNMSVEQRLKKQQPAQVLKSGRAVCEGYANLFDALCREAGLRSLIVTGYTKNRGGKLAPVGHAWNLVAVEGQWYPVDITWGAGGVDGKQERFVKKLSEEFFLADPVAFVQHHLPHDPLFQLLPEPVSFAVFKKEKQVPVAVVAGASEAANTSELDAFFALDEAVRQLNSCRRAVAFDPENGFGNFTLAKWEYETALASYQLFSTECQAAFDKKLPLSTPMVDAWERHLNDYRQRLRQSGQYLDRIRPGDPVSDAAKASRDALRKAWEISRQTEGQFREYRQYLARTGN